MWIWLLVLVTDDRWHVTCNMWHMTCKPMQFFLLLFLSVFVHFFQFLSVSFQFCPFLSVSVCLRSFMFFSVCVFPFLSFRDFLGDHAIIRILNFLQRYLTHIFCCCNQSVTQSHHTFVCYIFNLYFNGKNPAYGINWISWRVRIVAPMQNSWKRLKMGNTVENGWNWLNTAEKSRKQ